MIDLQRGDGRFVTRQAGIASWHSFSAGPHYDPSRLSFGALIGVDEHILDPGARFATHGHRAVDIVTWVLAGALRHRDSLGNDVRLTTGDVAVLRAGSGVEHEEGNDGAGPSRFVQSTVTDTGRDPPSYERVAPPVSLRSARYELLSGGPHTTTVRADGWAHVLVVDGMVSTKEAGPVGAGDALLVTGPATVRLQLAQDAQAQLWSLPD